MTVTISAEGNCGGTPANCGTSGNRNGDRDTTWPGLQVDEGDLLSFKVNGSSPVPASSFVQATVSASGTAWTIADLRSRTNAPLVSLGSTFSYVLLVGETESINSYVVDADGVAEGDETITQSISGSSVAGPVSATIGTPSSVTVTIRGTDSAPSFGTGSVPAQSYTVATAITEFQIPAATGGNGGLTYSVSGLPAGLVFDADGAGSCPGTEPREVCGTPTTPTSGAQTVTVRARDADSNTASSDEDSLSFAVSVAASGTVPALASNPSPLTEANLGGAALTLTLPSGATFASDVSASSFALVTNPAIAGLSISNITGGASGSTSATLTLATSAG